MGGLALPPCCSDWGDPALGSVGSTVGAMATFKELQEDLSQEAPSGTAAASVPVPTANHCFLTPSQKILQH